MATSDLENLAEAQRETVRALAVLTEQLRAAKDSQAAGRLAAETSGRDAETLTGGDTETRGRGDAETLRRGDTETRGPESAGLGRALDVTARLMGDLALVTATNTQAVSGLSRELGRLPELLAGLAGGVKSGSGVLGGVLKSGFGLASLGLKIAGLFRGGKAEPTPLAPFLEPPALALEVANTENILAGLPGVSRGQQGEARAVERQRTVVVEPQVTVNVSAMDSQSFLDRSGDIARAVREAMLHMHPVNDLIS